MQKFDPGKTVSSDSLQELATSIRDKLLEVVQYRLRRRPDEDCEDIVGDIMAAVIKNLKAGKFDPEKGTLQSYVFKIASNTIADFINDEKKRQSLQHDPERAPEPYFTEEDRLEKEEEKEQLRNVLKKLPVKYQEVLYLKFYEELRVREISEQIKLPPRRVSERINYGLKLLAKRYKGKK